ncbi:MAG TPA: glutamate-cysteine ligase family protein [Caldilineaceae bacterium]|nr:glutamate-cysteine ligase family protein [Caldilineaceae bacterium]
MHNLNDAIDKLAEQFIACFPEQKPQHRTVGREAEYPIVRSDGQAADGRRILEHLRATYQMEAQYDTNVPNLIVGLQSVACNYALEVGVGTLELNTPPTQTLWDVEQSIIDGVQKVVRAAASYSWQVLGYGIQPVSPPSLQIMAPKQRYQSLYRAMGASWLWYTVTASDQCHVAIGQPELVQMLNVGNMIAPVLIALCGNSPIFGGRRSPFCSAREGRMVDIHATEHRHGMPLRPYTSIGDYVHAVSQSTYLILKAGGEIIPSHQPFTEYLREHGPDFNAFLYHEHYIWNSARLRTVHGTVEIRPACQQPWAEQMAAAALTVGLMEAAAQIESFVQEELGPDYWERMRTYHQQTIRHGLAAPQPLPDFLTQLVAFANAALERRGHGEEKLLTSIYNRLFRRQNPAQRARQVYEIDGMQGLLRHTAIRPEVIH